VRQRGHGGEKLPPAFRNLEHCEIEPRRSGVSLVAAATGGGKSAFALAYARLSRIPTLYMAADTPGYSLAVRLAQQELVSASRDIEEHIDSPAVKNALLKNSHIRFALDRTPTVQDVADECRAYIEIFGEPPPLVVVDNLINIQDAETEGDYARLRRVVDDLVRMAGAYESHIMALCHTKQRYDDADKPIPLSGLEFGPSHNVDLVLTLRRRGFDLTVHPVKSRYSPADPSAESGFARLFADLSTMTVRDWDPADAYRRYQQ
jgi:AAA domain-containing protein